MSRTTRNVVREVVREVVAVPEPRAGKLEWRQRLFGLVPASCRWRRRGSWSVSVETCKGVAERVLRRVLVKRDADEWLLVVCTRLQLRLGLKLWSRLAGGGRGGLWLELAVHSGLARCTVECKARHCGGPSPELLG